MKARKVLYGVIVSVFLLCVLSMSVMGTTAMRSSTFTHTFSTRGDAISNSNTHLITGKICRMATNYITVRMDANTAARNIKYTIQYRTSGFMGIMGVADSEVILNRQLGNSGSQSLLESYSIGLRSFVDASFDGVTDVASMRGFATGADDKYHFEIVRAMFTFANN